MKTIHTVTDYLIKGYTDSDKEELKNRKDVELRLVKRTKEELEKQLSTGTGFVDVNPIKFFMG